MSNIDDGGSAFPVQSIYVEDLETNSRGMTLRDWFATHATEADIKDILEWTNCSRQEARYIHADAMLKARSE